MAISRDLFYEDEVDVALREQNIAPSFKEIKEEFNQHVNFVLKDATLKLPDNNWEFKGGRKGMHSEHLGHLLAQMQYMQRAYPNMEW